MRPPFHPRFNFNQSCLFTKHSGNSLHSTKLNLYGKIVCAVQVRRNGCFLYTLEKNGLMVDHGEKKDSFGLGAIQINEENP